jgi:hypothetical protein
VFGTYRIVKRILRKIQIENLEVWWGRYSETEGVCWKNQLAWYELANLAVINVHNLKFSTIYNNADSSTVVRFEVFTAVTLKNGVFWDVTPCGFCKNQCFGATYRLLHQVGISSQRASVASYS